MDTLHDPPMALKNFEEDAMEDGEGLLIYTFYLASLFHCVTRLKFETVGANALSWLPSFCLLMVCIQAAGNTS